MVSSYGELMRQLPKQFRSIQELDMVMKAHAYGLDQLNGAINQVGANHYIETCDERTLMYYEQLLGITYRFGDTPDYRRARILQKFNTIVPFSIVFLQDKLKELYGSAGYELDVISESNIISIKVTSDRYGAIDLLYDFLWDIIPAHLRIIANQEMTNYVEGAKIYGTGFLTCTLIQTIGGD